MVELAEARAVFQELTSLFHGAGWILAMYGSCLTDGRGGDVDLLAVPWRPPEPPDLFIQRVFGQGYKPAPVRAVYRGLMGTDSFTIDWHGMVLDVIFREVRPREVD